MSNVFEIQCPHGASHQIKRIRIKYEETCREEIVRDRDGYATKLKLPEICNKIKPPERPHYKVEIIWYLAIFLLGWLFGPLLAKNAPLSPNSRRTLTMFYWIAGAGTIMACVISYFIREEGPLVVLFCLLFPLILVFDAIYLSGLSQEAKRRNDEIEGNEIGLWERAKDKYDRSYYCEVEGIVFDKSNPNDWAEINDLQSYLRR